MTDGIHLDAELLKAAFPFHVAMDRDLRIVQHGPSIARLLAAPIEGESLTDVFTIDTPRLDASFDAITRSPRTLFVLRASARDGVTLRGQMLHDPEADVVFFVGSPWVTSTSAFAELGITLTDFAPSDAVVDYLFLLQNQATALAEARALAERLSHQAMHDDLTGLANRTSVLDQLIRELDPGDGTTPAIAVLMLDLDGFKAINDSYGHGVGDDVLRAVADRLRTMTRGNDTVARFGGDEFMILIRGEHQRPGSLATQADALAERVLDSMRQPIVLPSFDAVRVQLATSVGIAIGRVGDDADEVIRNADLAMYAAKHHGKDRVERYTSDMHTASMRRLDIASQLREAIEREQFELVYQPVLRLADDRFVGAEALLRWVHPSRGVLTPDQFLDVAEESGLIVKIGSWVIDEACRELRSWTDGSPSPSARLHIAVNLSARQLEADIVDSVRAALTTHAVAPAALKIEITEGLISGDRPDAHDAISGLKALGAQLSIDDFGTGYSSLSRLRESAFDELKIDRRFVSDIDDGDTTLVAAQVAMANGLGLNVVAEGVETAGQLRFLRDIGCQEVQGFHVSRPLPAQEIRRLFAGDRRWSPARADWPPPASSSA